MKAYELKKKMVNVTWKFAVGQFGKLRSNNILLKYICMFYKMYANIGDGCETNVSNCDASM